jgi:addiction module HigA family antidote
MSAHQLADVLDVPANRISEILRERRSVTADTALRLAAHFKTTPEFWLNLQIPRPVEGGSSSALVSPRYAGRKPVART